MAQTSLDIEGLTNEQADKVEDLIQKYLDSLPDWGDALVNTQDIDYDDEDPEE